MLEKKIIDNGITYQLIGEVYYPVLIDAELPIGIYAKKRIEYLAENNLVSFDKHYTKYQFHYEMFCLNCYCEQLFQRKFFEYLEQHPDANRKQIIKKKKEIKDGIIEIYILQPQEVIYNGKELEITKQIWRSNETK